MLEEKLLVSGKTTEFSQCVIGIYKDKGSVNGIEKGIGWSASFDFSIDGIETRAKLEGAHFKTDNLEDLEGFVFEQAGSSEYGSGPCAIDTYLGSGDGTEIYHTRIEFIKSDGKKIFMTWSGKTTDLEYYDERSKEVIFELSTWFDVVFVDYD